MLVVVVVAVQGSEYQQARRGCDAEAPVVIAMPAAAETAVLAAAAVLKVAVVVVAVAVAAACAAIHLAGDDESLI